MESGRCVLYDFEALWLQFRRELTTLSAPFRFRTETATDAIIISSCASPWIAPPFVNSASLRSLRAVLGPTRRDNNRSELDSL